MMQGSLAERLRVLRARRGFSLSEAAEKTGVTRDTLSELERGKRHAYTPTLSKIAKGYGVPVEELLEEPVPLGDAPTPAGLPEWAAMPDLDLFSRRVYGLSRDALDRFARDLALGSNNRIVKRTELPIPHEEATERAKDYARAAIVDAAYSRRGWEPPTDFIFAFGRPRNALAPEASEADTPPHEDAGTEGMAG